MSANQINKPEYIQWVDELKQIIQTSQIKAALSVNKELLRLYWKLGESISRKIHQAEWGNSMVETLARDLRRELPNQKGFSRSNLFSMKKWYEFYSSSSDSEKVQQVVGQIPWGHNVAIISKVKSVEEGLFYAQKTLENNWSRSVLTHQIKLKCYVVVELKSVEFKAEFAGKLNLYLSAVDETLKTDVENPTIGLLLCKSKSKIVAEYALRGMSQPIGIAAYELSKAVPEDMKANLPTIEEIESATTKAISKRTDNRQ